MGTPTKAAIFIYIAKARILELRKEIAYHNELYYNRNQNEISYFEYDKLTSELRSLEASFPQFDDRSSPSHNAGGAASKGFSKVRHEIQMNLLQDVFDFDEVKTIITNWKDLISVFLGLMGNLLRSGLKSVRRGSGIPADLRGGESYMTSFRPHSLQKRM